MARLDPAILAHLEWLGFVRPTGLVVSAPALVRATAILGQRDTEGQRLLRACLAADVNEVREPRAPYGSRDREAEVSIQDFRTFAERVLEWRFSPKGYAGIPEAPIPSELEVTFPDVGETLRPDYAVRELDPQNGASPWQLLVQVLPDGQDFDRESAGRLALSPHSRMERLLRHTGVPAGLLVNGAVLRLISAPRRESSGWLDFRVADMAQPAGRPICSALRLLLCEQRLLAGHPSQRLAALLADSRKFQNEVSEKLAEQVLHALYELLRGFQAADDASKGELLRSVLAGDRDEVYRGLLTVILRLVFLLYAEERDMLPEDETFLRFYSLAGLHERLREDAALYPDTLDQRYGAWAQLIALFRMVHDGAEAAGMRLPPRHGVLFDPDRYPFLEGRPAGEVYSRTERIEPPLVPDGTVFRALEKLRVLDGEQISYRALDVEQIGSVYETMMGFRLEIATGRSVAIKSHKKQGAPTALDLDALLTAAAGDRAKMIEQRTGRKLTDRVKKAVSAATRLDELHAALQPVIDCAATPDLVPRGAMVLQPSEARRRSGSHYTPRELTAPIVQTTLDPILDRLRGAEGKPPRPEAILELKVCDPAMGSGAFLVEACRYLGDALLDSWRAYGEMPAILPDENEVIFAQRVVAQRCLYGVDRNPVAVDLAKMSLWLATLAKDHPLTFIDHALRHGDSLVGLTRKQIENFDWDTTKVYESRFRARLREQVTRVAALRQQIRDADETVPDERRRAVWDEAQRELGQVRFFSDLAVAAFFDAENPRKRPLKRLEYVGAIERQGLDELRKMLDERRHADPPLAPFHWEIEFPEVFERELPGFDAFVGNPPFAGKNSVAAGNVAGYQDWLQDLHTETHGNADLVAHFFRSAFDLLRARGTFGLIATNTIAQGDTRASGLRWICNHAGDIYAARRRVKWPGMAAVVVSVVHVMKEHFEGVRRLDGHEAPKITAFLFHRGGNDDPARLAANAGKSFQGSIVLGMGFTFDDTDTKGVATPIAEMQRLIAQNPRNQEVIFPYIGGEEVNSDPKHAYHRYVINFGERTEEGCRRMWPELMKIVEQKVKPDRVALPPKNNWNRDVAKRWWQFGADRMELRTAIAGLERVLVICRHQPNWGVSFLPAASVFAESLIVFPFSRHACFCALQSHPHEIWARFFGSSMKDDLRYTPSDCFETFPFPGNWEADAALEAPGRNYYEFRATLMIRNNEGLTKTYNRFHDPDERDRDILKLRELHAAMDRAALDAYGWTDISTHCEFLLDYEIDEEEWGDKKKPYRYRWPDDVRDEVLARLLELNAERARAEALAGDAGRKRGKRGAKATRAANPTKDFFS
ncbi:MAG: N-6 DNA methylase [Pseudomonadota bacterium]|jgi:hypothetical protein|nr:N-6 DNA methylase [Pseudomonadota bacterium]